MSTSKIPFSSATATLFLATCFLLSSFFAQLRYDAIWQEHFELHAPIHRFVLPAPIVKQFTFGFQNMVADYYWVTAVQDFNKWDKYDFYYPEYFRIISTLDPKFEYPYIFAALTLPSKQNPASFEWLRLVAERGIYAIPQSWQIPYYTGVEFHAVAKSYEQAVHYLGLAAAIPGSPEITREAYALFMLHTTTDYQKSRALFTAIYETADNDETKSVARERIMLLDLIEDVDQASIVYKEKYRQFPASVLELSSVGLIAFSSEILRHYPINIDMATGKASLALMRRQY